MNRIHSHLQEIDLIGKLADLKTDHYHHTLAISAIIELLIEKNVITLEQLQQKMLQHDANLPPPTHPIT